MSARGPLFGTEVEYGFTPFDRSGARLDRSVFATALVRAVAQRWPALAGGGRCDVFLANGSRLYVDCGHPEYASPESTSPESAVACLRAGNRILEVAAQDVVDTGAVHEMLLFRSNTDAVDPQIAYGSHENYRHDAPLDVVARNLMSHLVTRTVFTGAGGIDITADGISFVLSPRARFIVKPVFTHSTSYERGIVHVRHEPLAAPGSNRLHVVCGETLCSEWADYLRIGTTALIVALVDAGIECGVPVTLVDPVDAMHTVARDVTCAAQLAVPGRRRLTAIAVQRHYLGCVREHLERSFMPAWAPLLSERWAATLDALESDAAGQWKRLDWPLKLRLFREWAARRGLVWDALDGLSRDLRPWLKRSAPAGDQLRKVPPLGGSRPANVMAERSADMSADANALLAKLLTGVRDELLEIDVRFGQLGPRGLFGALDRAGELAHCIVAPGCIERMVTHPPRDTRARLRGRLIRRLAGRTGATARWTRVVDPVGRRAMILDDPYGRRRPRWQPFQETPETLEILS